MISQTAEYALRAVVYLAIHPEEPCNIRQIAHRTRVPEGYLSKVMQNLARHRLVASQRGQRGGFSLLVPPEQLTLYDVIEAVDPLPRIKACPLGLAEHQEHLCSMHGSLDNVYGHCQRMFKETTIASIAARPPFG